MSEKTEQSTPSAHHVSYRRIEPSDDQQVRDLYELVQVDHATGTGNQAILAYVRSHVAEVFASDFAEPYHYYNLPGQAFWVAEAAGSLVGMAGVEHWPGDSQVARLRHVMVHPMWRRRRIASTILGLTESWCAEHGYMAIRLTTTEANDVAIGIYLQRGYVETDRTPGQATMTYTMEKTLRRAP